MKSIKVLGIAVATLGIAASIGGAIALYQSTANPIEFIIGAGTHTDTSGSVSYKINGASNPTVKPKYYTTGAEPVEGPGLSETYSQVKYSFVLSAQYNDIATPMYTVGNLAISLTNVPEAYRGHLEVWAAVEGYGANTLGQYYYAKTFMKDAYAITNDAQSYVANRDIAVASGGVQTLDIYLKFSGLSNDDLYAKDEAALSYTLSVTWGAPSSEFDAAYIVSDKTGFDEDDAFMMAPNIGADQNYKGYSCYHESDPTNNYAGAWQWVGVVQYEADTLTEAKCRQNDKWSGGNNYELESGKTYDVYWSGTHGDSASFDDR